MIIIVGLFGQLVWLLSYIHFRSRLYPMVCIKLAWHKFYILFRFQQYPMV